MPEKQRVVITDFINDSLQVERDLLDGIAEVEAFDALDEGELVGKIESADAIMLYHNLSITEKSISTLTQCKLIVRCGVGFDNVDHAYARSRGPIAMPTGPPKAVPLRPKKLVIEEDTVLRAPMADPIDPNIAAVWFSGSITSPAKRLPAYPAKALVICSCM